MTSERLSLDHVGLTQLPSSLLGRVWWTFKHWYELGRARRTLARFDARMLEDIGITKAEAWRETRRPFWSS